MNKKIILFSIIFFLAFFAGAKNAKALDVAAANLELATVQTACDEVAQAAGGTVYLPAGTSPWWTNNLKLVGGVNLIGAGSPMTTRDPDGKWTPAPTTVIRCAIEEAQGIIFINSPWHTQPPRYTGLRISGIKIVGSNGVNTVRNVLSIREGLPGFRIDHCEFDNGKYALSLYMTLVT